MAGAKYNLWLSKPDGTRLAPIDRYNKVSYTRSTNNFGPLTMTLPAKLPVSYFAEDNRIEVWRQLPGGVEYLDTETVWYIRKFKKTLSRSGERLYTVGAYDANYILTSRITDYPSGASPVSFTGCPADNVMKHVLNHNFGASAISDRNISAYLTVQPFFTAACNVTRDFASRNVLGVLQELARDSTNTGIYLAFDTVYSDQSTLEFRTYTNTRNVDHRQTSTTAQPVVLAPERKNLVDVELENDYSQEITWARCGGMGQGPARISASAQDQSRTLLTPFNRHETFYSANNTSSSAGCLSEAGMAVRRGRPRTIFTAEIVDIPSTAYGLHWKFGDYLTAVFDGDTFDCRVESVTVTLEGGKETVKASLRSDDS